MPPVGMVDQVDQVVDLSNGEGKLTKKCLVVGKGKRTPKAGAKVVVHYTGTLTSGTKFDSSRDRGEPFTFTIGQRQVIKGWDEGVASMRKGERSVLTCHHSYAYGEEGRVPTIPPSSTLVFDVELISWSSGEDVSEKKDGSIIKEVLAAGEGWNRPAYESVCKVVVYEAVQKKEVEGEEEEEEEEEEETDFEKIRSGKGKPLEVVIGDEEVPEQLESALKSMAPGEAAHFVMQTEVSDTPVKWADVVPGAAPSSKVSLTLHLEELKSPKQTYEVKEEREKIEEGEKRKKEGNDLYKNKKFRRAAKKYEAGLSYTEGDQPGLKTVRVPLLTNLAAVQLEMAEFYNAEQNCTKALGLDAKNIRALTRRMKARRLRGDYDAAREDFQLIVGLEPGNAAAKAEMDLINKELREQKKKDKAVFGGMFEKLAKKTPLESQAPVQEQPDLEFKDDVPRVLHVVGCSETDAVGEYRLNMKDTHRKHPFWLRQDPNPAVACWRIFSDPHGRWKLGKLGEFEQGLGYVKSANPHETKVMPHQATAWLRTNEEGSWVEDSETKISTKPLGEGPLPPKEN